MALKRPKVAKTICSLRIENEDGFVVKKNITTKCDIGKTALVWTSLPLGKSLARGLESGVFTISTRCGAGKLGTILLRSGKLGQYQSHRPLSRK